MAICEFEVFTGFPTLAQVEKDHLRAAMTKTGGHQGKAAELLGVSRWAVSRLLKTHGLQASAFVRQAFQPQTGNGSDFQPVA